MENFEGILALGYGRKWFGWVKILEEGRIRFFLFLFIPYIYAFIVSRYFYQNALHLSEK